jgi:hypothetical protein
MKLRFSYRPASLRRFVHKWEMQRGGTLGLTPKRLLKRQGRDRPYACPSNVRGSVDLAYHPDARESAAPVTRLQADGAGWEEICNRPGSMVCRMLFSLRDDGRIITRGDSIDYTSDQQG